MLAAGALAYVGWRTAAPAKLQQAQSHAAQRATGQAIYARHCASCHGARLEGEPNWQERRRDGKLPAPPHDDSGHTWHHPESVLFDIVKHGLVPGRTAPSGYATNMPAFGDVLTDAEIRAVLAYIAAHWSPRVLQYRARVERRTQEASPTQRESR